MLSGGDKLQKSQVRRGPQIMQRKSIIARPRCHTLRACPESQNDFSLAILATPGGYHSVVDSCTRHETCLKSFI